MPTLMRMPLVAVLFLMGSGTSTLMQKVMMVMILMITMSIVLVVLTELVLAIDIFALVDNMHSISPNLQGALDGKSEPVCKATSGTKTCVYSDDLKICICSSVLCVNRNAIMDAIASAKPLRRPINRVHNRSICDSACL